MVLIQRSKGYSTRKSLTLDTIEKICKIVKQKNPNCICFVDNCYGEFVDTKEPLEVGADLMAGSLIKNPGGGIVEAGGYIAGKSIYGSKQTVNINADKRTITLVNESDPLMLTVSDVIHILDFHFQKIVIFFQQLI